MLHPNPNVSREEIRKLKVEKKTLAEDLVAWEETERTVEEEFELGFLEGYVDLKRWVALEHRN